MALAHHGPLRIQRALYPEGPRGPAHVYLLHPPGGVVGGDELEIHFAVDAGASALVTTPAAGKFYRSDGRVGTLSQTLHVAAGATLEWLPLETIIFDGAAATIRTAVELQHGACFAGWDILALGRPAGASPLVSGWCEQRLTVRRNGKPLWIERARYGGGDEVLTAPWGLDGATVVGTLVMVTESPWGADLLDALAAKLPASRAGVSERHGVCVVRVLGDSAEDVRDRMELSWALARPHVIGVHACPPRVWRC